MYRLEHGLVACALLFATASPAAAAGATMGFWNSLQPDDQQPFLAGAMDMLGGLGLQCPERISLKEIKTALTARQQTGKASPTDRFVAEVLAAHYVLGCTLEKRVFDSLDPGIRKKLTGATP